MLSKGVRLLAPVAVLMDSCIIPDLGTIVA